MSGRGGSGLSLLIALLVLASACIGQRGEELTGVIIKVVDGDTVYVRLDNGTVEKVRLVGVDTPELEPAGMYPGEYDGIKNITCLVEWGFRAKEFAEEWLEGKRVILVLDPLQPKRDRYGRLLAYVYVDGVDFNAELVKRGLARVYVEGSFEKKGEYLRYQREAVKRELGLWACG
ncbi:thermonuclease [Pyrococcus yayanosii CH1]|uniref:Thermonuclease n=1 Tax=Pyrococcus yayanosii (strain CH1 / JCM 16557) TaxID=529709 RepID=F8AE95_PYRYC|nr:thermonuclease [Pyrococcus yayanosii CH1]